MAAMAQAGDKRGPQARRFSIGEFELVKIGARRFDLSDPYHFATTASWPLFMVSIITAWAITASLFAAIYLALPGTVNNLRPGSVVDAFFFSFQTLASAAYGNMYPANLVGNLLTTSEVVIGIFFTAIMTGLIFLRFSKARSKIVFADSAVITLHNGKPHLVVRIGNGRHNPLADVNCQIACLVREITLEGSVFYNVYDLKLTRTRTPIFPLTINLMHEIDRASPLHGRDAAALAECELRLFVSVDARDPAMGATVNDLKTYGWDRIVPGMRFADVISKDEAGRNVADLTRISLLEDDPFADGAPTPGAPAAAEREQA
jgi:inward rectifier potassium channel